MLRLGVSVDICNSSAWGGADRRLPRLCWPDSNRTGKFQVDEEAVQKKKKKMEGDKDLSFTCTWASTHTYTHPHTRAHTAFAKSWQPSECGWMTLQKRDFQLYYSSYPILVLPNPVPPHPHPTQPFKANSFVATLEKLLVLSRTRQESWSLSPCLAAFYSVVWNGLTCLASSHFQQHYLNFKS